VLPEHFAILDYVLPVRDMDYPAIDIGEFFDDPRDLSCSYPLAGVSEFVRTSQIDPVNEFLDLGDGEHLGQLAVVLDVEPGEEGLEGAIGAAPPLVIEGLIAVVIVLVDAFGEVLQVHVFGGGFDEDVRVVYLLWGVADGLSFIQMLDGILFK
jgi:hypothetical protein